MSYLFPCKPNRIHANTNLFRELANDPNWVAEVKKDGWRCLIEKLNGKLTLWTRHKTIIKEPLESVRMALIDLPDGTLLDSELVWSKRIKGVLSSIQLFDAMKISGQSLANDTLVNRRAKLEQIFCKLRYTESVAIVDQIIYNKDRFYNEVLEKDEVNEGIVIKRLDSKYLFGRSSCPQHPMWLKVKER